MWQTVLLRLLGGDQETDVAAEEAACRGSIDFGLEEDVAVAEEVAASSSVAEESEP